MRRKLQYRVRRNEDLLDSDGKQPRSAGQDGQLLKNFTHSITKNAIANIVRGGAGAAVAFFLPPLLTRLLDRDHFAAWALLLQVAAYVNFLDFGIQTGVARFIAQAMERDDTEARDGYISTAFVMLTGAGVLAFIAICGMAWLIPELFKQAPLRLLSEMREGLILLAAFSAAALPTSTFTGVFIGLRRNEYPALVMGACRLAGAALVLLAAHRTHSLVAMAGLIGSMNLMGGVFQGIQLRRLLPDMRLTLWPISGQYFGTLLRFCSGLSVWSFAGFLIGGLDLTIVGFFQFSGIAYYSLASNAVLLVSGLCGAATNAMIAPAAAIHARGDFGRLGRLVVRATGHMTRLLIIASFPFFIVGTHLLTLWVGIDYAHATVHILQVLLLANVIRMIAAPYAAAQVGAGEHVRVMYSPLFEGFINLGVSISAGYYMGPIGVAIGTLVGSVAGNAIQIFYNIPRIVQIKLRRRVLLVEGVVRPAASLIPALGAVSVAALLGVIHPVLRTILAAAGILVTALLVWRERLPGTESEASSQSL